jgi:hypothetical protein
MGIHRLPSNNQELASLEARLNAGDLTLGEIREIEDEILLRPIDEKTRKIGEGILVRAGEKRKTLVDREVVQLDGKSDLGSKVQRLNLLNGSLSPDEAEGEIDALLREIPLEEDVRAQSAALKMLEDLEFAIAEPIVHEFQESSESTYSSRMLFLAKTMLSQNSLIPFKEGLNAAQHREIVRYAAVTA